MQKLKKRRRNICKNKNDTINYKSHGSHELRGLTLSMLTVTELPNWDVSNFAGAPKISSKYIELQKPCMIDPYGLGMDYPNIQSWHSRS